MIVSHGTTYSEFIRDEILALLNHAEALQIAYETLKATTKYHHNHKMGMGRQKDCPACEAGGALEQIDELVGV